MISRSNLICVVAASVLLAACSTSYDSAEARKLYKSYEKASIDEGRFRTDTAPSDAPFSNEDLAQNFVKIALKEERVENGVRKTAKIVPLTKWRDGVRYAIGGDGYSDTDKEKIAEFLARMEDLTGISIAQATSKEEVNYKIIFYGPETRAKTAEKLKSDGSANAKEFGAWVNNVNKPCSGSVRTRGDGRHINWTQILIKNEVEGLFRETCIHEEIAQSFGLKNDDPSVRPSLFNDDQEFAHLTKHDEYLLRALYDPRLEAGMTEEDVTPLLPAIIDDLRPKGHACCS